MDTYKAAVITAPKPPTGLVYVGTYVREVYNTLVSNSIKAWTPTADEANLVKIYSEKWVIKAIKEFHEAFEKKPQFMKTSEMMAEFILSYKP